ncbi:hypothetical protein [uncultured Methanobrevibacter sp.]|uniref:hypothetical protein n=1 Tax=uncultured Methanobrevibacter sp. TaxID=253161 RepID=UPI00263791B1|nr:hypothetical protein [uncultured Methanobrevibacter sp.]
MSTVSFESSSHKDKVTWEGHTFFIQDDSECSVTDTTLTVTSNHKAHNIELKKTTLDASDYEENIAKDHSGVMKMKYNSTHSFIAKKDLNYGVIVPTDSLGGSYADIEGNPEIIEVNGGNIDYMISFILSSTGGGN